MTLSFPSRSYTELLFSLVYLCPPPASRSYPQTGSCAESLKSPPALNTAINDRKSCEFRNQMCDLYSLWDQGHWARPHTGCFTKIATLTNFIISQLLLKIKKWIRAQKKHQTFAIKLCYMKIWKFSAVDSAA